MAVSWGGYESLIIPRCAGIKREDFNLANPEHRMLRLYVGLEDPASLITDPEQGLCRHWIWSHNRPALISVPGSVPVRHYDRLYKMELVRYDGCGTFATCVDSSRHWPFTGSFPVTAQQNGTWGPVSTMPWPIIFQSGKLKSSLNYPI